MFHAAAYGLPSSALVTAVSTFHIAMRIQNLEQMIKGRPAHCDSPSNSALIKALHGAKWHLWHGCPYPALRRLESLGWDLDPEEAKLLGKLEEFVAYLDNNRHFIVNYGDHYRHGEPMPQGSSSRPSTRWSASGSSNGSRWPGALGTRTTCFRSEPPCSITSSGLTLNDGIRPSAGTDTTALPLSRPPVGAVSA